jgi:hypothetical protein
MNLRTRISVAVVGVLSALALVVPATSYGFMKLPPVKIAAPSHNDPEPDPMTKDWLLHHGYKCTFGGGSCSNEHGDIWDCSDPNHCVRPG